MTITTRYESEKVSAEPLARPLNFEFSGTTANNRFLKAAMTERMSSWDPKNLPARGIPSKELVNVYRRWGEGGYGLILTGNIMIEYDQLEAPGNPIITSKDPFSGERFEAFKALASAAKANGSLIVGQVSHPGRQTAEPLQANPVSASDVQLEGTIMGYKFAKPHAATQEEIAAITESFAHAAEYLYKAGYSGIELHGAHGYLLAQFLALGTNLRTDKYGGSLENRSRIILEIADEIRKRVPKDFILSIKLNSVEFQKGGFDTDDCRQLCANLEKAGFDFVELSGGTYESLAFSHKRESTKAREAFFLDFADAIVPALTKTKVYVTGGFRTTGAMVGALKSIHGIGLARPACQEPSLPADIIGGKVHAAAKQLLDENDFGITNVAAGSQIKMLGNDKTPIDLTKQENLDSFMKQMGTWKENMGKDKEGKSYGFVPLDSLASQPYGVA